MEPIRGSEYIYLSDSKDQTVIEISFTICSFKVQVADAVIEHLNPIRLRIEDFMRNPDYLDAVLRKGCDKSSAVAQRTITEVKEKIGVALVNRRAVLLERKQ